MMSYLISDALADAPGWAHMGGWGWFGMMFGWVLMASLVAAVAWTLTRKQQSHGANRAIELVDERYARGEIGRDEYLERTSDLRR